MKLILGKRILFRFHLQNAIFVERNFQGGTAEAYLLGDWFYETTTDNKIVGSTGSLCSLQRAPRQARRNQKCVVDLISWHSTVPRLSINKLYYRKIINSTIYVVSSEFEAID